MIMPLDVANYALAIIMAAVTCVWIILLSSMIRTHRHTPRLEDFEKKAVPSPRVSIILPARNEEGYIERCLDSLIKQDYPNYEIVAIDDSSEDRTGEIIAGYAEKNSKVVHVAAGPKPEGWMGKNWACMEGYKKTTGDLLLFTDSDTKHDRGVLSLAVAHLLSLNLDALTVIPRLLCLDFWTRITLPVISTFLHTQFSALRVNDPSKKTGYFFGSFFIMRKKTYEDVGMHEGVKHEIIEDGALGKKTKESGHRIRMVLGDSLVDAVWARDLFTLWHALRRLMVPLYVQNGAVAVGIFFAVLFLLFAPFALLAYSAILFDLSASYVPLLAASISASSAIYAAVILETRMLNLKLRYALFGPLGGLLIVLGFQSGLLGAARNSTVRWRGRTYSVKDHAQNFIGIW